jgi:hypothetical protein
MIFPAGSTYALLNQSAPVVCAPPSSAKLNVRICSPLGGSTVSKTFTVRASGNSPAGVSRLELWVDGKKTYEVLNDQLQRSISVSAARHRVAVVVVDRYGKTTSAAAYVTAQ